MPTNRSQPYVLKTTPAYLIEWATALRARKQERTFQALYALDAADSGSLRRTRFRLGQIVAAPVRFSMKFEDDPAAALCLVVLDRALGYASLPEVDQLVDAAFMKHDGNIVAFARALLDDLAEFSRVLWRIHDRLPLSEMEERFARRALEDADFEMHHAFVTSCLTAAEYLGDDLSVEEPELANLAFYAWLLQAFPTALPTFGTGARVRLLRALAEPAEGADSKELETYVAWVIDGSCVNALDHQVVRTRHLPLLRAFVAEAPHGFGERARALLEQLETHGLHRWAPGGRA